MGKQSSQALRPDEIESLARQQNRMNNPNQTNIFGSTQTTFGPDDQASITQTLSEPMQNIINSQMDFVSQGPGQLGNFSNPFIEGLMQGAAGGIANRGGYGAPSTQGMGNSYNGSFPIFNAGSMPQSTEQPNGPQQTGVNGGSGIIFNSPQNNTIKGLAQALGSPQHSGQGNVGTELARLMRRGG